MAINGKSKVLLYKVYCYRKLHRYNTPLII